MINLNNINNNNNNKGNDIFKDMNNFNYNLDNLYLENKLKDHHMMYLISYYVKLNGWLLLDQSNAGI